MTELKGQNILVVGLGKSGAAAARFLKARGAVPKVTDQATETALPMAAALRKEGVPLELDGHRPESFEAADMIVLSPGVPHTLPEIIAARENGVPVWGEIELAARHITEPIVAVTGTNGKTTTTELLGEMLSHSGRKVFVGGNIGTPLVEYAAGLRQAEVLVIEMSSFQLDTIDTFHPRVAVLLNVTEDHMDRYTGLRAYAQSKGRIFKNQTRQDVAVFNAADPLIREVTAHIRSKPLRFNLDQPAPDSAWIGDGRIRIQRTGQADVVLDLSRIHLLGRHNQENVAAAALAALAAGATPEGVQSAIDTFKGLPHRLEHIACIDDVNYFDDSKATNVDAVARALALFEVPVILILGGRDKGGDYGVLEAPIREHVRQLILLGEAADRIQERLGQTAPFKRAASMNEAVQMAHAIAEPGDAVLLSPACASFDMFDSYAHRGNVFREAALHLQGTGK